MIINKSTMPKIPKTPQVSNFNIPNPVSPMKNLSIPRTPKNKSKSIDLLLAFSITLLSVAFILFMTNVRHFN